MWLKQKGRTLLLQTQKAFKLALRSRYLENSMYRQAEENWSETHLPTKAAIPTLDNSRVTDLNMVSSKIPILH
jgi:hypothetical protein